MENNEDENKDTRMDEKGTGSRLGSKRMFCTFFVYLDNTIDFFFIARESRGKHNRCSQFIGMYHVSIQSGTISPHTVEHSLVVVLVTRT